MKLYISRIRQPDGTWFVDPEARTLRETKRLATIGRCLGGMVTQIWPLAEAEKVLAEELAKARES